MSFEKEKENKENELTPWQRQTVDAIKEMQITKLKNISPENFNYNSAWRNFVITKVARLIGAEKTMHIDETEKEDWSKELKKAQEVCSKDKNKGWFR